MFVLLFIVAAFAREWKKHSAVVHLTDSNSSEWLDRQDNVALLTFTTPWCKECRELNSAYENLAKILRTSQPIVSFAMIDGSTNEKLVKRFDVSRYPTYKLMFTDGQTVYLESERLKTQEALVDAVLKATQPMVDECRSREDCETFINDRAEVGFIGEFRNKDSREYDIYNDVAKTMRLPELRIFTATFNKSRSDEPMVTVQHPNEMRLGTLIHSVAQLTEWVTLETLPLFGPVHENNFELYRNRTRDWVVLAAKYDDFQHLKHMLRNVAGQLRERYNFVWIDVDTYGPMADSLLAVDSYPRLGVVLNMRRRFLYPENKKLSDEKITEFIHGVEDGSIRQYIRSEASSDKEGDVDQVVGSTFEKVINEDRSVLAFLYSPGCEHCNAFSHVINEVAKTLRGAKKFVRVVKMNAVANDIIDARYDSRHLPAAYFKPPGKVDPVAFDMKGPRTAEALLLFIRRHAPSDLLSAIAIKQDELR